VSVSKPVAAVSSNDLESIAAGGELVKNEY
jgi:hypothetical protein